MAVPEQTPYKEYTANGSTTSFALGFICESKNDLIVLVDGVAPPVATWSLIGANAVFTTAPASGKKIILQRQTKFERTTNFQGTNNSFRPETINKDIDRVWLKLQELGVADMLLKIYVDRLHQEQKEYIDQKDDELKNYLIEEIRKQGVALDQLEDYYNRLMQKLAEIALEGGWTDSVVATWSGRTQEEKNKESLSPYDFGAIGNGVADDTEALKLYAAYCSMYGNKMMLGRGTYRITDTIPGSGFLIHGEKGFCKVIADNMEGKGIFDLTVPVSVLGRSVGSVDVEYEARGANISYAVATPENSSQYALYYLTSFFTGNYCHGEERIDEKYSFAWDYSAESWFKIGDCVGALFEKNNIQGSFDIQQDPSTQFHDVGVTTKANGAVMSLRMSNNNIGPIYRAVVIGDKSFATIHDNDLIGTYDSIVWEGTNLFNEPKVYSNNMNAQRFGVHVKGPGSLAFKDNTIRRHSRGWKGATHDWYGFYLENISELKLAQNTVQPDQSGGAFSGDSHAYYLKECSLAGVSGNFVGVGNAKGITLDNCTGLNVTDTITAQNAASDILFNLVNNTRLTNIGSYQLVSSFNGEVLAKDATITNAITMLNQQEDIQSISDIVQDITRTSSAANSKKWRQTVGSNTLARRVVSDAGANINYEIITRNGTTIETIEWRAGKFKFNNGPEIFTGAGSPEGLVTAPKGSMYLRTDSSSTETLYIKQSGVGNTGWVAK